MELQNLVKAFEDRVATHRNMRLTNLEDGKVSNTDHSLGICSGLKLGLGLFADVVRELLNPTPVVPPVIDNPDTSTDSSSSVS